MVNGNQEQGSVGLAWLIDIRHMESLAIHFADRKNI